MSFVHEHRWSVAATPSRLFSAFTDAAQLRVWFAEQADIGAAVGAPFRFWGRHSLETPTATEATQRILVWEPEQALAFSWTIAGVSTQVTCRMTPDVAKGGEHTTLVIQHEVHGALPFPRERELIDDLWRGAVGNLIAFLTGGAGLLLPDFTDPAPEVRQEILIDAPRDVVFRTLVTPALVNEWFGAKDSIIEPRTGGRYAVGWQYQVNGADVTGGPTRILEYVENERLVLDWPDWRGDASVNMQTISFTLESVGNRTRLIFVHAGFGRATDMSDYPFGWVWFLSQLQSVATRTASAAT
jgi:uncharacterized protein YndB with AHSA1/START domain